MVVLSIAQTPNLTEFLNYHPLSLVFADLLIFCYNFIYYFFLLLHLFEEYICFNRNILYFFGVFYHYIAVGFFGTRYSHSLPMARYVTKLLKNVASVNNDPFSFVKRIQTRLQLHRKSGAYAQVCTASHEHHCPYTPPFPAGSRV